MTLRWRLPSLGPLAVAAIASAAAGADRPQLQNGPARLGYSPQEIDVPWLPAGDLYYMHKVAETIEAYRGLEWPQGGM
jgi:hypothetical protein